MNNLAKLIISVLVPVASTLFINNLVLSNTTPIPKGTIEEPLTELQMMNIHMELAGIAILVFVVLGITLGLASILVLVGRNRL